MRNSKKKYETTWPNLYPKDVGVSLSLILALFLSVSLSLSLSLCLSLSIYIHIYTSCPPYPLMIICWFFSSSFFFILFWTVLRGVKNKLMRRNIFFYILQICFICPNYSETKNKEVEKRRQAFPFSLRMICSIVHEGKGEKGKKKDGKEWTCKSTPFPYIPI